ncbi:MAG: phage tail tape measure protein [Bacteroidota bacterium]
MATRTRTGGVSSSDTLLELGIGFRTREGVKRLVKEIAEEEQKTLGGQRKRQRQEDQRNRKREEREEKDSAARLQRVREELIERRRRLAVASIGDELKRRKRAIEEAYREERRRIKLLLKERLDAGDITAKKYRQQLENFDKDLRTIRDRQLEDAPRQTLRQRAEGVLSDRFGGQGSLGGLLGGRAAIAVGAGAAGAFAVGKGLERAIALASSFEDQLVEVRKTTGLADDDLARLGDGLLDLATKTGIAQDELAGIAAVGGQLGIQGEANLLAFTETVAKFSQVTELSADQAADALAKTAQAFDIPIEQLANLASAANELSNTTAARAGDIIDVLQRVGASGVNIGLTADEVAGLAATLIDAGIDSERAGTSLRNIFTLLLTEAGAVAETVGVTEQAFREMISDDALGAIQLYLEKLGELDAQSRAIAIEETFGRENTLQVTTLATAVDELNGNLATSRDAFQEGESLNREFDASLDSLSAQWNIFTARVTKAATEVGQGFVPALTSALRTLNGVERSAEAAAASVANARAEVGRLEEIRAAVATYEQLAAKVERTAEEEDELTRITQLLADEYPEFITKTDAAGRAMGVYAGQIRQAVDALIELRRQQAIDSAADLAESFRNAELRRDEARSDRERNQLLANDPEARRRSTAGTTGFGGFRQPVTRDRAVDAARAASLAEQQAARDLASARDQIVQTLRRLRDDTEGLADFTAALAGAGFDSGTLQGLSVQALSQPNAAPRPTPRSTPTVPTGGSGGSSSSGSGDATDEDDRARERQRAAFESLQAELAEITAERIEDETEREIAAIQVQLATEIDRLDELKEVALTGEELTAAERLAVETRTAEAILDLRATSEREIEQIREKAAEKLEKEQTQLDRRRIEAESSIAQERLRARSLNERAEAESIENLAERRLAVIEAEFRERERAIEQEYAAEIALAGSTIQDQEQLSQRLSELRLKRSSDLREAELKRVSDVEEAEQEADEQARRRMERRRDEARRYAEDVFGVVADALETGLFGSDALSQAQIDLEIASFMEAEKALAESLRRRQIDQETYQLRMDELSLRRQEFDEEVERDRAGFLRRSYLGLRDLFVATLKDQLIELAASKTAELVLHTTTEEGKTASTLAGALARGGALVVEAGQALFSAAASMVSAVASQIASVVKSIPFPFNLALIPVGVAAVTGAYFGARGLFFEGGGFVGREGERGPDDVTIVVGRGEAVLNSAQQAVVEQSLQRDRGFGLRQLFETVQTPHSRGPAPSRPASRLDLPTFERGGFALPSRTSVSEATGTLNVDLSPLVDELQANRAEMQQLGRRFDRQLGEIEQLKRSPAPVLFGDDDALAVEGAQARARSSRRASAIYGRSGFAS